MNEGVVLSLEPRASIVLTPDGRFVRVKKQPLHRVGETIVWSQQDLVSRSSFAFAVGAWRRTAGLAAALLLVLLCGWWTFRTPPIVAYVTMDVNPSVEMGIDARERVRKLEALNGDAEPYVEGIRYRGRDVETVTREIAEKLAADDLLDAETGEVVLASVPQKELKEGWEDEVAAKMKQAISVAVHPPGTLAGTEPVVAAVTVPEEIRDAARSNGISAGKMAFWLMAEKQGHDLSLDTLKSQSIKKIAEAWGGVEQVLGKDAVRQVWGDAAGGREDWSKLLKELQQSRKVEVQAAGGKQDGGGKSRGRSDDGSRPSGTSGKPDGQDREDRPIQTQGLDAPRGKESGERGSKHAGNRDSGREKRQGSKERPGNGNSPDADKADPASAAAPGRFESRSADPPETDKTRPARDSGLKGAPRREEPAWRGAPWPGASQTEPAIDAKQSSRDSSRNGTGKPSGRKDSCGRDGSGPDGRKP
jgi:hypothetical protein